MISKEIIENVLARHTGDYNTDYCNNSASQIACKKLGAYMLYNRITLTTFYSLYPEKLIKEGKAHMKHFAVVRLSDDVVIMQTRDE